MCKLTIGVTTDFSLCQYNYENDKQLVDCFDNNFNEV